MSFGLVICVVPFTIYRRTSISKFSLPSRNVLSRTITLDLIFWFRKPFVSFCVWALGLLGYGITKAYKWFTKSEDQIQSDGSRKDVPGRQTKFRYGSSAVNGKWYYTDNQAKTHGPVPLDELRNQYAADRVFNYSFVWNSNLKDKGWRQIKQIKWLMDKLEWYKMLRDTVTRCNTQHSTLNTKHYTLNTKH
jgi:hypothetical protein